MDAARFSITEHGRGNGELLIRLHGELDMAGAEDVRAFIDSMTEASGATIRIDCAGVEFIDTVGIKALMHLARRCQELGAASEFILNPRIERILDAMGVGSLDDFARRGTVH